MQKHTYLPKQVLKHHLILTYFGNLQMERKIVL